MDTCNKSTHSHVDHDNFYVNSNTSISNNSKTNQVEIPSLKLFMV